MNFEPRTVPSDSWKNWFKDSLNLTARKPFLWVLLVSANLGIFYLLENAGDIFMFLAYPVTVLFMSAYILAAYSADNSSGFIPLIKNINSSLLLRNLAISLIPVALFFSFVAVIVALGSFFPDKTNDSIENEVSTVLPLAPSIAIATISYLAMNFVDRKKFFIQPLILLEGLTLEVAKDQAERGNEKNTFLENMSLVIHMATCLSFGLIPPYVILPFLILYPSLLYVGYRDIWVGRGKNKPIEKSVYFSTPAFLK